MDGSVYEVHTWTDGLDFLVNGDVGSMVDGGGSGEDAVPELPGEEAYDAAMMDVLARAS